MGRPTLLTPELAAQVVGAIAAGATHNEAAAAAGIGRSTLQEWLERGRDEEREEPFADFADEVDAAHDQATARLRGIVERAADGDLVDWSEEEHYNATEGGELKLTGKTVRRRKVPSEAAARWLLTRRDPARYGDQARGIRATVSTDAAGGSKTVIEVHDGLGPLDFAGPPEEDSPNAEPGSPVEP